MKRLFFTQAVAVGAFWTRALAGEPMPLLQETPSLEELVKSGVLPPIGKRIPEMPSIVTRFAGSDGPGRAGGQINMLIGSARDTRLMTVYSNARLIVYDDQFTLKADILESYKVEDGKVFTFKLRPGHKWSDGHPFTTEDFRFYWEDVANNMELSSSGPPAAMLVDGRPPKVDIIDETTIRYSWNAPNPYFIESQAQAAPLFLFRPAHYLKKFHIRYTDAAQIAKAARGGQPGARWVPIYRRLDVMYADDNVELPSLNPWVNTTSAPAQRFVYVRNAYYYRIDFKGVQLPYIDRVIFTVAAPNLVPAKAGLGEADLQSRYINMRDYTSLKRSSKILGMDVRLWESGSGSQLELYPNMNCKDDGCPSLSMRHRPRPERRLYNDAVRSALVVLWEASDRICGKRLKPLVPLLVEAMGRYGHLRLEEALRDRLLSMSAATIDRMLHNTRISTGRPRRRAAASALKRSIPIRTFKDWTDPPPGFFEADLVAHCGPRTAGSYVQALVLTDIATGWTECAPSVVREQQLLITVLSEVRNLLPFALLGFATDNDSVFMNETVHNYCAAEGIAFTRCRPYRKNDQAWVEQKNGAIVRKMVGYRRLTGITAATAVASLYAATRLFVNFFQPSFKLAQKRRDGAWVLKRYYQPATLCQRLSGDPRTPDAVRQRREQTYRQLDPIRLLHDIRAAQHRLVELADALPAGEDKPALDDCLANLRTAWQAGEVRPTARVKPKAKRECRRPDPLLAVTAELPQWFAAEPSRSGCEFLQKPQAAHLGLYPDGLLRTVQRRVKIWRADRAHEMVFGAPSGSCPTSSLRWAPGDAVAAPGRSAWRSQAAALRGLARCRGLGNIAMRQRLS